MRRKQTALGIAVLWLVVYLISVVDPDVRNQFQLASSALIAMAVYLLQSGIRKNGNGKNGNGNGGP